MDGKDPSEPTLSKLQEEDQYINNLRQKLEKSQRQLHRTEVILEKSREKSAKQLLQGFSKQKHLEIHARKQRDMWDRELQTVSAQLLFLEGQLKKEQQIIKATIEEKDKIIAQQQTTIARLMEANAKLTETLHILKERFLKSGTRFESDVIAKCLDVGDLEGVEYTKCMNSCRDTSIHRRQNCMYISNDNYWELSCYDDAPDTGSCSDRDNCDPNIAFNNGEVNSEKDSSFDGELVTANGICRISKQHNNRPIGLTGNVSIELDGSDSSQSKRGDNQDCTVYMIEMAHDIMPDILANVETTISTSTPYRFSQRNKGNDSQDSHNAPTKSLSTQASKLTKKDVNDLADALNSPLTTDKNLNRCTLIDDKQREDLTRKEDATPRNEYNYRKTYNCGNTSFDFEESELLTHGESDSLSPLSTSLPNLHIGFKSLSLLDDKMYRDSIKLKTSVKKLFLRPKDVKKKSKERSKSQSNADRVTKERRTSVGKFLSFKF